MTNVLSKIQAELKAPKGQYNNFGKYKYRSCEDILEAVKPILEKYECHLILNDLVNLVGDRYYIYADAKIWQGDNLIGESKAMAREPETKKGMDPSQITGSASSYARKYALNGLLCIDDTKDADTEEGPKDKPKAKPKQVIKPTPEKELQDLKGKAWNMAKELWKEETLAMFRSFPAGVDLPDPADWKLEDVKVAISKMEELSK